MALRTITNNRLVDWAKLDNMPAVVWDMLKADNLSGLANYTTARSNLWLWTLATQDGTFSGTSSGTNTGDETASTIKTKLWIATLSWSNTWDDATNTTSNTYADGKIAKAANITSLRDTSIADWHIAVFNLTNKDIRTSSQTIVTTLWTNDSTVPTSKAVKDVTDTKLPLAWGTMTGKIVSSGSSEVAKTYTPASWSQTVALDCALNNIHEVTGNASGTAITFTVANVTNSQCFMVAITQWAVVSTIAGRFATIKWAWGTAPTLTATVWKRDTSWFRRTWANTYDGCIIWQNC